MEIFDNKIGLEAEFLLRDKDGNLVIPYSYPRDDFEILGEIRGEPGKSMPEAVSNFYKKFLEVSERARSDGFTIDLTGHAVLDLKTYKKVLEISGPKETPQCRNIYGTEILGYSDTIIENGLVVGHRVSSGLHIHFSSSITRQEEIDMGSDSYLSVVLPIGFQNNSNDPTFSLNLYRKVSLPTPVVRTVKVTASQITFPVITHIVSEMDKLLPKYCDPNIQLKYRQPGYYEIKPWGFEYRSLPFNQATLSDLDSLTAKSFELLKGISLV